MSPHSITDEPAKEEPNLRPSRMLGKKVALNDLRLPRMANYLDLRKLPKAPANLDLYSGVAKWDALGNNDIGNCTCVAVAHLIQGWTAANGDEQEVSKDKVIELYSKVTGYKPGDASTDNGAYCLDVLREWVKVGLDGRKIGAFTRVNPRDYDVLKTAAWLFGGLYVGVELPDSAQDQDVWDDVPNSRGGQPGSWGGHCIPILGYTTGGSGPFDTLVCNTWGENKHLTYRFWKKYVSEVYVALSVDWADEDGTPDGFDYAGLTRDMKLVTQLA